MGEWKVYIGAICDGLCENITSFLAGALRGQMFFFLFPWASSHQLQVVLDAAVEILARMLTCRIPPIAQYVDLLLSSIRQVCLFVFPCSRFPHLSFLFLYCFSYPKLYLNFCWLIL
ncbi:hypothetical protein, unlikely [Trypanosoma brucei gambiense DAL972]|uniref:Uncharacterized protein n=1 Tax=Trypanosoma brucei gambiense (strain MHOM/CI/86/DAL972) TaxID=679716 RepID=D0A6F5_TRYB9|nr:hypothetical protein, unlikely [Trypanosoma brucei gambiense DAL972]CBH17256.1 hypothetical protein, unlikely [Trypanosoma brucei gambiense DAL972]|eukprot:XP_011779520.1 hypothetical protein, unlikely [Trypanosoma brucei gambiense DAL972]